MGGPMVISAKMMHDGRKWLGNRHIVIEGGRVTEIFAGEAAGAIEAAFVTPAFIDAHSHIGMMREGEPNEEREVSDGSGLINILHNPIDSVYFDDPALGNAVDFGVLYSCILPGSSNLVGGRAMLIRNFARNRRDAVVADIGFKLALGYNPRANGRSNGKDRPDTRMGTAAVLRRYFDDYLRKERKASLARRRKLHELDIRFSRKSLTEEECRREREIIEHEYALEFTPEEEALKQLLGGRKIAKVHVHREDDIIFLVELVREYGLKASAEHAGDITERAVFDELAGADIPIVYGPIASYKYKVELKNASYKNAAALAGSKARFGLMSDHPITQAMALRDSLQYFLIHGMNTADALSLITLRNAEILGVAENLGSLGPGKLASLLVWDKDPFYLGSKPVAVMAEGKVIRGAFR